MWCVGFVEWWGFFLPRLKVNVSSFSMPPVRSWQIIPPLCLRRERFGFFSCNAVIWKVLQHFVAILKINLKLKANQLSKHTCSSKMFWEVSLKQF